MPQSNPTKESKISWYKKSKHMLPVGSQTDTMWAAFGQNPGTCWYWDVGYITPNNVAACYIDAVVQITYYCYCWQRKVSNYD